MPLSRPEPLSDVHELGDLSSGVGSLDDWLRRRARANQISGASRTFVVAEANKALGYYALASGGIAVTSSVGRFHRNMPDPIPVVVLGRLAIDRTWQGKGLGGDMLRDAVLRVMFAGESIGVRAILVHAISGEVKAFYEKHGFRSSPVDPMALMITLGDAKRMLSGDH